MAMEDVRRKVDRDREDLDRSRFPGRGRGPGFMPPGLAKKPASFWEKKGEWNTKNESEGDRRTVENTVKKSTEGVTTAPTPAPVTPIAPAPAPMTPTAPAPIPAPTPVASQPMAPSSYPSPQVTQDAMNSILKQYGMPAAAYAKGGMVKKKRKPSPSGKGSTEVRGKGKAQRGIRPCKMY